MSQLINSFTGEIASTPEGRAWVTKALHPADPITECTGIPDSHCAPTVLVTYNSVFRIQPPAGETATWGFDMSVIPNVICPAFVRVLDRNDTIVTQSNFLNQGLTPPGVVAPTYEQLFTQFRSLGIEAHRLVYMGVTSYQDGPALADQGTIVAAQWQVARRKYCPMFTDTTPTSSAYAARRFVTYQEEDYALYGKSQYLPNAYFSKSKDGCYLPLRLSGNEKFTSDADLELFCNPISFSGSTPTDNCLTVPGATGVGIPPFPSLVRPFWSSGGESIVGSPVYKPLNDIWGGISTRNLSVQTSFAFYVRMSVECRVNPTSVFASQVRMSPMYDPVALAAYSRLSRELKDAYPADFNDLGKIWEVIKKAARMVLPVTSMLGPTGAAISGGVSAALNLIDAATSGSKNGSRGESNPPPAAAVERVRRAIAARPLSAKAKTRPRKR